jgi:hypothetical protein
MTWWRWLWFSDGGLACRIALGVGFLVALAIIDYRRNGRQADRWREYLFLAGAVAVAMLYALANDMVTVTISPEYFLNHENLEWQDRFSRPGGMYGLAAGVALRASWSAGLMIGVVLLVANNPSPRFPRIAWRRMYRLLGLPAGTAAVTAAGAGGLRWLGGLDWLLGPASLAMRPFETVYAVHAGAYLGGLLGTLAAVIYILHARRGPFKPAGNSI